MFKLDSYFVYWSPDSVLESRFDYCYRGVTSENFVDRSGGEGGSGICSGGSSGVTDLF